LLDSSPRTPFARQILKIFLPVQMSGARALSMQNLTRTHANVSLHRANNKIPLLQKVLISSGFLQCMEFAFAMCCAFVARAVVLRVRDVNDVATRVARRG
jgi:hypothetical protein